jgi:hypothetical protein
MAKYAAFGTAFKRSGATVGQVANISGPGLSLDTADATTHDSPGGWEEVVPTILRSGEVTLEILFDPDNVTHQGLRTDMTSKLLQAFSLVFVDATPTTWSFNGYVTRYEPGNPHEGLSSLSCTIKISGQPTLA